MILVTGSIGIDTIDAPAGRVENVLGGSAVATLPATEPSTLPSST